MKKIVMVVNNPATNDYRVVKTAELVAEAGYESHVIGILTPDFSEKETLNGVTYQRFKRKLNLTALFAGFFPSLYVNMRLALLHAQKNRQEKNNNFENSESSEYSLFLRFTILLFYYFGLFVFVFRKIKSIFTHSFKTIAIVIKKVIKKIKYYKNKFNFLIKKVIKKIKYYKNKFNFLIKKVLKKIYCMIIRSICLFKADKSVIGLRYLQGSYLTTFFPILYELNADIYHAHELWVLESCALASKQLGSKLVYDSHELERHRNLNWKEAPIKSRIKDEEKYISYVDEVFAVSEGCAKVIKNDYNLEQVHLLRNSPILKKLEKSPANLRNDLNLDDTTPLLVYTGSVTFNRGLELILESLKELTEF
ncbi:MAG: glycosyltransferase family 4 protein, partial [Gammaproteobacteria bacterium]|nr:glycosyltransferase family 4 protein [Gammaproteobacteria bacterium]